MVTWTSPEDKPQIDQAYSFTGRITLSNGKIAKTFCAIYRIEIYPVNSVLHPSNNRGQVHHKNLILTTEIIDEKRAYYGCS